MRDISETLLAEQKKASLDALIKIQLTHGASSYTYARDRILDINHTEEPFSQRCELVLDNSDGTLTALDFKGYKGVISYGMITSSGEEYSGCAPLWVLAQRFNSSPGILDCVLSLVGIPNLMADDKANATYLPTADDTKTVKTLIREIAGDTGVTHLACFNHCQKYDVVFDSEDTLILTYKPRDSFRIYLGGSRLAAIRRLLDLTKNVMIAKADGKLHIFLPQIIGTPVYTYSLEGVSPHQFFSKAYRNRLVIPNRIVVQSQVDDSPSYSGEATDSTSYALLPKTEYRQMRLGSNEQATDIAKAILSKAQLWSDAGALDTPMELGSEVYDYINVVDARQGDERAGNIGSLTRHYNASEGEWRLRFSFGNWMTVRKALANLDPTGSVGAEELEQYFTRLMVKDLYVENIRADNLDMIWLDPEGNIDLSKIGDNLDSLPDGELYARIKSLHMDAGQLKLDEHILYKSGYNPTSKFDLGVHNLDNVPEGTIYRRAKSAALTAEGLVVLDNVVVGDYGLIYEADLTAHHLKLSAVIEDSSHRTVSDSEKGDWGDGVALAEALETDIQAGRVTLSRYTNFDDEWYDESGVEIDARHGINIYGKYQAFTTRATKTGTIQCYVGSDGKIYAGGGAAILDSDGIRLVGTTPMLKVRYYAGTILGSIFAFSSSDFRLESSKNLTLFGYDYLRLWANDGIQLTSKLIAQGADINTLYDILPYNTGTWLGKSDKKYSKMFCNDYAACPLPTTNSAIEVIRRVKTPTVKEGHYGMRHYFDDDDFPDEMKMDREEKDKKGNITKTRGKEIELSRTIGILVQAVRELTDEVDTLKGGIS